MYPPYEYNEISSIEDDDSCVFEFSDIDSIFSSDDDNDDYYSNNYDTIYDQDSLHIYSEKINNHYYIGTCNFIPGDSNLLLFANSVSTKLFFKYSYNTVLRYLRHYSILYIKKPSVDIMKLSILDDGTYSVIKKTYWIKLIQRHWKKCYKERTNIIKRISIQTLRLREITGKFPSIPSIYGMLHCYSK